jgi:hypothetical protein
VGADLDEQRWQAAQVRVDRADAGVRWLLDGIAADVKRAIARESVKCVSLLLAHAYLRGCSSPS